LTLTHRKVRCRAWCGCHDPGLLFHA
jgi:hypothetical protein